MRGPVHKTATVHSNDPAQSVATLELKAVVKAIIDILPQDHLFLNAFKGQGVQQEVTIVNNEEKHVNVTKEDSPAKYITTELQTVEKGKKYKLVAKLSPETPVGRFNETVTLHTDNPKFSTLPIKFNVYVRSVVSAYPPTVHFGTLKLENLGNGPAHQLTKFVIVRKHKDNKDFKVEKVTSDSPYFKLAWEPTTSGNNGAFKITVTLDKDTLKKDSPINGSISVITNDKEVPELKIPITGKVL